jgi:hypothetical protein
MTIRMMFFLPFSSANIVRKGNAVGGSPFVDIPFEPEVRIMGAVPGGGASQNAPEMPDIYLLCR